MRNIVLLSTGDRIKSIAMSPNLHELQIFLQEGVGGLCIGLILLVELNHHDALLVLGEGRLLVLGTLVVAAAGLPRQFLRLCHGCSNEKWMKANSGSLQIFRFQTLRFLVTS